MGRAKHDHHSDRGRPYDAEEDPESCQFPRASHFRYQGKETEREVRRSMHRDGRDDASGIVVDPSNQNGDREDPQHEDIKRHVEWYACPCEEPREVPETPGKTQDQASL